MTVFKVEHKDSWGGVVDAVPESPVIKKARSVRTVKLYHTDLGGKIETEKEETTARERNKKNV